MKTKLLSMLFAILVVLTLTGCDDDDDILVEDACPATPQGVYSVTGDGSVTVWWNGIYERDVREYVVYRSLQATTGYEPLAVVTAVDNPNLDLLLYYYEDETADNGETYWYALTAVDYAGQESELSAEDVWDTPRPEGRDMLYPYEVEPALAGFNLAAGEHVAYDSPAADIWVDRVIGRIGGGDTTFISYLNVGDALTDIQDMGYALSFDSVSFAPESGWSRDGYQEIIEGHIYVIWTNDSHYAKLWAVAVGSSGAADFIWAYQTVQDNLQLAPAPGSEKPDHGEGYVKTRPARDDATQLR